MSIVSKVGLWSIACIPASIGAIAFAAQSKAHKEQLSEPQPWLTPVAAARYTAAGLRTVAQDDGTKGTATAIERAWKGMSDSKILFVAHVANACAIAQARMAQEHSVDGRVRRLAAQILRQHVRADRNGEALIERRRLDMTSTPTGSKLRNDTEQMLTALARKRGADFDRAYVDAQVEHDRRVLDLIDGKLLPNVSGRDVQALLYNLHKNVQAHLGAARALQIKINE
jgi:putative membrane protein